MGEVMIVTGAAGYLGRTIVASLIANECSTIAIVRPGSNWTELGWEGSEFVKVVEIDLASNAATTSLFDLFTQHSNSAVIHCAGLMSGSNEEHAVGTVAPTSHLIDAMVRSSTQRLVLISSFSVYGYSTLPDGAVLDETTPTEYFTNQRDAYSNAKLQQELLALKAAQNNCLRVSILRAGAIIGKGKEWTSRIGFKSSKLTLIVGGEAFVPIINVDNCASAAVDIASRNIEKNEVFIDSNDSVATGSLETINLVESNLPTQNEYFEYYKKQLNYKPSVTLRIPYRLIKKVTALLSIACTVFPKLLPMLPNMLRDASMCARFKPLQYDNSRLKQRIKQSITNTFERRN